VAGTPRNIDRDRHRDGAQSLLTMTLPRLVAAIVVTCALAGWQRAPLEAQWPQFRGPDGTGHASATELPLTWGEGRNVRWKTAVHGRAWSSPVILDNQVWMTTATEDGKQLFAVALDQETGKVLYDLKLFEVATPQYAHPFNTYASPTPALEPGRVYVTFGSPGTAAIDTRTGKVIWERRDFECNHYRGAGSSPVIFGDLLLMHFDGSDHQFVVGLDKKTGKTVWRTARSIDFKDLGPDGKPQAEGDFRKAFATPQIVTVNGRPVMISLGSKATYGYDPRTGEELWRIEERGSHSASTRPVAGHGLVFYPTGFQGSQLLAIKPDGKGDVTASHIAWRMARGAPNKPSVTLVGDLLLMVNDTGIVAAVDAKTGGEVWRGRIEGTYSASPLVAGGRFYAFNEDGKTTILEGGREFKVLAENVLEDGFMASPAVAGRALYLRTKTHVYRIESPQLPAASK
jgi:outer membrane protein assembly factor BamB